MESLPRRRPLLAHRTILLVVLALPFADAAGQSIVEIYQRQRMMRLAEQALAGLGGRFSILPPQYLPSPLDTISSSMANPAEPTATAALIPISLQRWQRVPKLGQSWFRKQFSGRDWVFLGNDTVAPLDTMMTRDIRARLEAHFGKPTRTLGDFRARAGVADGEIFEFEYWFVLNDTIPLIVTDVNGPFERGIVASTVVKYEEELSAIRDQFLGPVLESSRRAAYVDYYYDDEEVQWYRAGYDGSSFFVELISQPGMNRPVLSHSVESQRE